MSGFYYLKIVQAICQIITSSEQNYIREKPENHLEDPYLKIPRHRVCNSLGRSVLVPISNLKPSLSIW